MSGAHDWQMQDGAHLAQMVFRQQRIELTFGLLKAHRVRRIDKKDNRVHLRINGSGSQVGLVQVAAARLLLCLKH